MSELIPEGKYYTNLYENLTLRLFLLRYTYLLQIISCRVSIENILVGTLTTFVISGINTRLVCLFVFMLFPFVLLSLQLLLVLVPVWLTGVLFSYLKIIITPRGIEKLFLIFL